MTARHSERPAPNLFLLGVTKGGTSTLFEYLRRHSQVAVSLRKEPNFFSYRYHLGFDWYKGSCFPEVLGRPVVCEATSTYLVLPWVAARIAQTCPQARLVVMLRPPETRVYSHWWMHHRDGLDKRDFATAMAESLDAYRRSPVLGEAGAESRWDQGEAMTRPTEMNIYPAYIEAGHYAENLERYLDSFPSRRLLVLSNRDLAERPEAVLARLWEFLELAPEAIVLANSHEHRARGPLGARLNSWALMMRLHHMLPASWIRAARDALIAAGDKPPRPDPKTMDLLRQHYLPHNQRLRDLLGRSIDDPWPDGGIVL